MEKMLSCGEEWAGYAEYMCEECLCIKKVPFSCKSRFCPSCGKTYVDRWINKMADIVLDVPHRHIVLTIPSALWPLFYERRELLDDLMKCGMQVVKELVEEWQKKKKLTPGIVETLQTFSCDGNFHPHLHFLVTEGGMSRFGKWVDMKFFSYKAISKKWQYHVIKMLREKLTPSEKSKVLLHKMYDMYPHGFVIFAKPKLGSIRRLSQYLARYVARPAIALSRITSYDREYIEYVYEDSAIGKIKEKRLSAFQFINWITSHIPEKGFQMIRYALYAKRYRKRIKKWATQAICRVKGSILQNLADILKVPLDYRSRMIKEFKRDPFICSKCGGKMFLYKLYHPKYGVIYDEVEQIKRGKYEKEQRTFSGRQLTLLFEEQQEREAIQLSLF